MNRLGEGEEESGQRIRHHGQPRRGVVEPGFPQERRAEKGLKRVPGADQTIGAEFRQELEPGPAELRREIVTGVEGVLRVLHAQPRRGG